MHGFSHGRPGTTGGTYSDPFEDEFDEEIPTSSGAGGIPGGFTSWAWNYFTGQSKTPNTQQARQESENAQFGDVFEEMLREQGMAEERNNQPTGKFWGMAGGVSGGVLGFILANFPGLMAGAVAGNRLGAVRDARGKSVYQVFQELPQSERAQLLTQLAAKIFSHSVGI